MIAMNTQRQLRGWGLCFFLALWLTLPAFVMGRPGAGKIFAQKLVEEVQARHPEVKSLEISSPWKGKCTTIAATDPDDVGEKCDRDELAPMRTGKPFVEREKEGYDVTLPLHDGGGKIIGSLGMDLGPQPGRRESEIIKRAERIARELESRISSKEKLFDPLP